MAVLCDDPPVSGSSLAAVGADLERAGVLPERIVIALALFGDASELPPALTSYGSVLLPFADWSIHRRLDEAGVRAAVDRLVGGDRRVSSLAKTGTAMPRGGRGHLKATYRLELEDTGTGERAVEDVSVEGVGLGYFGNHAVAVAHPLREYLPRVLGVEDGVLYRQWLPADACAERLESLDPTMTAGRIAEYVATRNAALPLEDDVALRLGGQYPAWEAASTVISRSFGRAWPVGRALLTDRAVRRLLPVAHPSDIDGRAELSRWFLDREHDRLVKVDWDQGSTWNLGLGCTDPVFDVARLAAASGNPSLGDALRHAFEARTGEPIEEERLLLYRLAQFAAPGEADHETRRARRRSAVRALQAYFRRIYFADLPAGDGPLCGIDIDGVLESDHLGVPALTPVSALALRALIAHGYRPLLVTGRSLLDVRERCEAYGLVGGVAEYGAVAHVAASRSVLDLRGVDGAAIASLLTELRAREGVLIDEDYTCAIRAYVRDSRGRRGPLTPETISAARRAAGVDEDRVRAIRGDAQTDFVAASTDKGRGVIALAAELGEPAPVRLALAVGDTRSDAPMLDLAARPCAPAHARDALGDYTVMRAPYQQGFAEAVGQLIGHSCGGCERCRLERPSAERRLMLGLLGLREAGMRGVPMRAMRAGLRWPV
jgi:hydroxymethylpyrimidine pyrophosphatase-like HAD family hydrolase